LARGANSQTSCPYGERYLSIGSRGPIESALGAESSKPVLSPAAVTYGPERSMDLDGGDRIVYGSQSTEVIKTARNRNARMATLRNSAPEKTDDFGSHGSLVVGSSSASLPRSDRSNFRSALKA